MDLVGRDREGRICVFEIDPRARTLTEWKKKRLRRFRANVCIMGKLFGLNLKQDSIRLFQVMRENIVELPTGSEAMQT